MKTPENTRTQALLRLKERYEEPTNSLEAFVLYAIDTQLRIRGELGSIGEPADHKAPPESEEFDALALS